MEISGKARKGKISNYDPARDKYYIDVGRETGIPFDRDEIGPVAYVKTIVAQQLGNLIDPVPEAPEPKTRAEFCTRSFTQVPLVQEESAGEGLRKIAKAPTVQ